MKWWLGASVVATAVCFGVALAGASGLTAPSNDAFSHAVVLSGQSATRTGDTNVGATLEKGPPEYEAVLRRMAQSSSNIRFLGHQSGDRLRILYEQAVATVVPSI